MSNTRYYQRGEQRDYTSDVPRIKNRVERRERSDEDQEIRDAVRANSASEYLSKTGD